MTSTPVQPADPRLSYSRGDDTQPLLDRTIGADLELTVAAYSDREALVEVASGRRWT